MQARWQALWQQSPQQSPFSTLAYVRALARAADLSATVCLIEEDGLDLAGAAVLWRQRGPYREVVLPPFTPFSALLLRTRPDAAAVHARCSPLEALLAALENRFHVLRLHLPPTLTDIRAAQWRQWQVQPLFTYHLPLTPGDDLPAQWSRSTRRNVRRAAASYHIAEEPHAIGGLVAHCADSYARHRRPLPMAPDALQGLITALQAAGHVRIFMVRPAAGRRAEGGLAVLHDGRTACYWVVGSQPGPAMTVLLGHLLPALQHEGFHLFDFIGANTPSIAEFKRRFGPELVPYYRLEKYTRPELRLLAGLKGLLSP